MDREQDAVDRAHEAAAVASEVITRARELRVIARGICGISRRLRSEIRRQQGITDRPASSHKREGVGAGGVSVASGTTPIVVMVAAIQAAIDVPAENACYVLQK